MSNQVVPNFAWAYFTLIFERVDRRQYYLPCSSTKMIEIGWTGPAFAQLFLRAAKWSNEDK